MPFRKYAVRFALEIALHGAILAVLLIVRLVLGQLVGQLFTSVEPQLFIPPLPPDSPSSVEYYSHPESGGCNSSGLQDMPMYAVIIGSFVYAMVFVGISTPRDEKKQVQAILGTILNGGFQVVREYVGQSLRMAAYSVNTLRARLEALPRYLEFPPCLGMTTPFFFSMINRLKMITSCLFFFGLGVVVTMAYYHSHSLSTYYARVSSGDFSLLASDLTDRAEACFATITKFNSIPATILFSLGLRYLIRSLVSSFAFISKEARNPILVQDKGLAESDEDTLCDDETLNLTMVDAAEDESERNVISEVQEAVSIPITITNSDKKDGLNQRRKPTICNLPSASEDSIPDRPISLRKQQVQYATSLSASSPEFVPRLRNTAAENDIVQDYCPPHWALAPPISVRIAAPAMNLQRIRRGARVGPSADMA